MFKTYGTYFPLLKKLSFSSFCFSFKVEYVSRGSLSSVLEEGPSLTWKEQKFDMCLDIAKGMAYLHQYK